MKFKDMKFSKENRFTLGVEEESGKYYLSLPVTSTGVADFEEYYAISVEEFLLFFADLDNATDLLKRCRERREDNRLMIKPGKNRGNLVKFF